MPIIVLFLGGLIIDILFKAIPDVRLIKNIILVPDNAGTSCLFDIPLGAGVANPRPRRMRRLWRDFISNLLLNMIKRNVNSNTCLSNLQTSNPGLLDIPSPNLRVFSAHDVPQAIQHNGQHG